MKKQSAEFCRAQNMVFRDKFHFGNSDYFKQLHALTSQHMQFDALTVQTLAGSDNDMIITICVKKVKPTGSKQA